AELRAGADAVAVGQRGDRRGGAGAGGVPVAGGGGGGGGGGGAGAAPPPPRGGTARGGGGGPRPPRPPRQRGTRGAGGAGGGAPGVLVVNAPPGSRVLLAPLPAGVEFVTEPEPPLGFVHLFVTSSSELSARLSGLRHDLAPDGVAWVSWPKKASGVKTDVT